MRILNVFAIKIDDWNLNLFYFGFAEWGIKNGAKALELRPLPDASVQVKKEAAKRRPPTPPLGDVGSSEPRLKKAASMAAKVTGKVAVAAATEAAKKIVANAAPLWAHFLSVFGAQ